MQSVAPLHHAAVRTEPGDDPRSFPCTQNLFQPHTHAKTAVVLLEKGAEPAGESHDVFMAVARWCGTIHEASILRRPAQDCRTLGEVCGR